MHKTNNLHKVKRNPLRQSSHHPAATSTITSNLSTRTTSKPDHPSRSTRETGASRQHAKTSKKQLSRHGVLLSPSYYAVNYTTDPTVSQWGNYAPIRPLPSVSTPSSQRSSSQMSSTTSHSRLTSSSVHSPATPLSTRSNMSDVSNRSQDIAQSKVRHRKSSSHDYDADSQSVDLSHLHNSLSSRSAMSSHRSFSSQLTPSSSLSFALASPASFSMLSQQLSPASSTTSSQRRFFASSHHNQPFPVHNPHSMQSLLENDHSTSHSRYTSPLYRSKNDKDELLQLIHVNNVDKHIDYILQNHSSDSYGVAQTNHRKVPITATSSLFTQSNDDHVASTRHQSITHATGLQSIHEHSALNGYHPRHNSPNNHSLFESNHPKPASPHHQIHNHIHTMTSTASPTPSPSMTDQISSAHSSFQSTVPLHNSITHTFSAASLLQNNPNPHAAQPPSHNRHTLSSSLRHFSSSPSSMNDHRLSVYFDQSDPVGNKSTITSSTRPFGTAFRNKINDVIDKTNLFTKSKTDDNETADNAQPRGSSSTSSTTTSSPSMENVIQGGKSMSSTANAPTSSTDPTNGNSLRYNYHLHQDHASRPISTHHHLAEKLEHEFSPLVSQGIHEEKLENAGVIKAKHREFKVQKPAPSAKSCEDGVCVDVSLTSKSVD